MDLRKEFLEARLEARDVFRDDWVNRLEMRRELEAARNEFRRLFEEERKNRHKTREDSILLILRRIPKKDARHEKANNKTVADNCA